MALRKHFSDVFKLSNVINSLACEKGAFPSATYVGKKIHQHGQSEKNVHENVTSLLSKHQSPSIKLHQPVFGLGVNLLQMSERETGAHEYKCPSSLTHKFSELVILDHCTNKSDYRLPLSNSTVASITDPKIQNEATEINDPVPSQYTPKESKEILKIRHKKMKKHKLKKLRKRMYFVWRKQKMTRKAKRDTVYWKEINDIKKEGEDFDAESFVKGELEKARRGGYYINVFHSKA